MTQTTVTIDGVDLTVYFDYTAGEINNFGHPDSRIPDVDEEVDILEVFIGDHEVSSLLNEETFKTIESLILIEAHSDEV